MNGNVVILLFRCVAPAMEPEAIALALALAPVADVVLFPSAYVKFVTFTLDVVVVADDVIDDSTDGNECVPLNCCVDAVENAVL